MKGIVGLVLAGSLLLVACGDEESADIVTITKGDMNLLIAINANPGADSFTEPAGGLPSGAARVILEADSVKTFGPEVYRGLPGNRSLPPTGAMPRSAVPAPGRTRPAITDATTSYTFNAVNMLDNSKILVDATRRHNGNHCYVFVEDGKEGSYPWADVAQYFDTNIQPKMASVFGAPTDVDENGKVVILFVDMQSGESFTTGVAGYYWPGDLFAADAHPSVADSNEMEVFYINMAYVNVFLTNGGPMNANILGTIAHEFQHMINFAQRVWQDKPAMDTWIDEGLSEGSEHYVLGTPNTHRIDYMEHPKIVNGTVGLVKWTGDLANYALSYTFLQYYRMQTGGAWAAYTDLIQHPYGDYRALLSGLQGAGSSLDSFRSLMRGYRLANLFRADGIYGYGSLNAVMDFRLGAPSVNVSTLPSGAAVYYQLTAAALQSYQPSGQGPNMIYVKVQSE